MVGQDPPQATVALGSTRTQLKKPVARWPTAGDEYSYRSLCTGVKRLRTNRPKRCLIKFVTSITTINITAAGAVDREFFYIEPPKALPKLRQTLPLALPEPPRALPELLQTLPKLP